MRLAPPPSLPLLTNHKPCRQQRDAQEGAPACQPGASGAPPRLSKSPHALCTPAAQCPSTTHPVADCSATTTPCSTSSVPWPCWRGPAARGRAGHAAGTVKGVGHQRAVQASQGRASELPQAPCPAPAPTQTHTPRTTGLDPGNGAAVRVGERARSPLRRAGRFHAEGGRRGCLLRVGWRGARGQVWRAATAGQPGLVQGAAGCKGGKGGGCACVVERVERKRGRR